MRRGREEERGGEIVGKTKSESLQMTEGHAEGIQRKRKKSLMIKQKFWQRVRSIKMGSMYVHCMKV